MEGWKGGKAETGTGEIRRRGRLEGGKGGRPEKGKTRGWEGGKMGDCLNRRLCG